MNKKKVIIIVGIILVVVTIVTTIIFLVLKNKNKEQPTDKNNNNVVVYQEAKVVGKLAEYIKGLTENYYIKYLGNFEDNIKNKINAIVEYTKSGDKFALRSTELNMHMIAEEERLYSISNRYKMIVEMGLKSFDISQYNLVSDFGQTFVKSYKDKISDKEYDVEEYRFNGNSIKYYFLNNEINLVKYNSETIKIIRVEKKTNSELLIKPDGYSYAIV